MAQLTTTSMEDVTVTVDLTPDYCFERAAKSLSDRCATSMGPNTDVAKGWKELGLAIHAVGLTRTPAGTSDASTVSGLTPPAP